MKYPTVSIVISTYNSERTIKETLESIRKQAYPSKKIEILVIDGGSKDNTLAIAKKYPCKIIINRKTEIIYAKHIGFLKSKGKYLMYLDSDEILENSNSIQLKLEAFKSSPKIKAIVPSCYKTAKNMQPINYYINEFGDPFTFFIYRESKDYKFLIRDFSRKYRVISEDNVCIVFSFHESNSLPLIELWAGGCLFDLSYVKEEFPQIKNNPVLISHIFYLLNNKKTLFAFTKNDNTIHYSCENIQKYLKKISSRVKNNIFQTKMGKSGYVGRENFGPFMFKIKKLLFIPYSFLIIPPTIDAVLLTIKRKRILYFIHLPLCVYASILIIYYLFLNIFKFNPKIKSYGN